MMNPISCVFSCLWSWTGFLIIGVLTGLYYWGKYQNEIFKRRGFPYIKALPFLGNNARLFLRLDQISDGLMRMYWALPKASVVGVMQGTQPMFMLRDPELIKEVTVKNFEHFRNHLMSSNPDLDPDFSRSIFSLKDEKWKVTRNLLSPAFTGSKMRIMFKLMNECAERSAEALFKTSNSSSKSDKGVDLETKDFFTRYANDTLATTTFGIEVNSIKEPENEFYKMGRILTKFGASTSLKFMLIFSAPRLFKLLGLRILNGTASKYFTQLVKDTIQYRIKNNIVRPDMLNMYIESLKGETQQTENEYTVKSEVETPKTWDYDDFVAQCVLFFFAGFETTATFFMLMAYELTINPEVQQKLIDEIDMSKAKAANAPFSYETLNSLKYMEMVVNETARKWPITGALDRVCNKDITLKDSNGKSYDFKAGDCMSINVFGLARDSQYFETPEKFIPDRFAPENKDKINPFTFLNFGVGPRMCLGNRFAMMECKCIFYALLSKFKFEFSEKTQHPLKFQKGTFSFSPENGAWIKLVPR